MDDTIDAVIESLEQVYAYTADERRTHARILAAEVRRLRAMVSDQAAKLRQLRDECHENERAYRDQSNKLDAMRMERDTLRDEVRHLQLIVNRRELEVDALRETIANLRMAMGSEL